MASPPKQNLSDGAQLWHDPVAARTRNGRRGFVAPTPPVVPKRARRPSPSLPSDNDDEANSDEDSPPPKRLRGAKAIRQGAIPALDIDDSEDDDVLQPGPAVMNSTEPSVEDPDLPELVLDLEASSIGESARKERVSSSLSSIEDGSSPLKPSGQKKLPLHAARSQVRQTYITLGSEIFSSDPIEVDKTGLSGDHGSDLTSNETLTFIPKRIRCVTKPTTNSETPLFVPKRIRCVTKPTTSSETVQLRPKRLQLGTKPVTSRTAPPTKRLRVVTGPASKPTKITAGKKPSNEARPDLKRTTRGKQSWADKVKTLGDKGIPLKDRFTLYSEIIDPKWRYQDWERLPGYKRAGETAVPERQKQMEKIHVELLKELSVEDGTYEAKSQNGIRQNVLGHPSMFTSDRYKYGRSDRITKTQGWIEARVRRG